jgi:hypothetical protein
MMPYRHLVAPVIGLVLSTGLAASNPAAARDRLSPGAAAAVGVLGGLAVGGAIAASQRPAYAAPAPVYVAPAPQRVYVQPRRVIVEEEDCWTERTREWVPGWGWQHQRRTVCR